MNWPFFWTIGGFAYSLNVKFKDKQDMHSHKYMKYAILGMLVACLAGCGFGNSALRKQKALNARNLGEAYMGEGKYTNALKELLGAYKANPDDPFLNNDLGLTYLAKGDASKAIFHFKRALDFKPQYAPAKNNLGSAYIALKQWDKAIACFDDVKDDLLYATPYYPLSNLGYVYFMKKDYGKAEKYYKEALNLQADFPKALDGLGQVYTATGRYKEAIKVLTRAISKAPTATPIYMNLARAYAANQEYDRALATYKKAAAIAAGTSLAEEAESAAEALKQMRR